MRQNTPQWRHLWALLHWQAGRAMVRGHTAEVPVQMVDEVGRRTLRLLSWRVAGSWRVDDLQLPCGVSLHRMLQSPHPVCAPR